MKLIEYLIWFYLKISITRTSTIVLQIKQLIKYEYLKHNEW